MCGRFNQSKTADEIRQFYGVTTPAVDWTPSYNIAPTDPAPVILESPDGHRTMRLMAFGQKQTRPGKSFLLINRQSEKLAENHALFRQRCIIPATGFYEWQTTPEGKQPWFFTPTIGPFFSLAGLWKPTDTGAGFTILTTRANAVVSPVHDRMPVILGHNAASLWLAVGSAEAALCGLLEPAPDSQIAAVRVSQRVNNAKHKDASCQNPL